MRQPANKGLSRPLGADWNKSDKKFVEGNPMENQPTLGIIGGSGLYEMPGLEETETLQVNTPFGQPSAPLITGRLHGHRVVFLARHGIGHQISPSEINYRANIYALKTVGVERIVSISACGSLREDYSPGHIVVPSQLFDFTKGRQRTFFEDGLVAHVSIADPFCGHLSQHVYKAVSSTSAPVHQGGSFITIEGPRFSTRIESNTFRSWGMSLIGMTTSPEAFLAREAEICYAVMAHVTDYDVWHISEQPVTVDMVIATLHHNTRVAQEAISNLVRGLEAQRPCECSSALASALITRPDIVPQETRTKLGLLVDKYLK
jgi:5'-methylthioadenosine phosphorylase